MDSVFWFGLLLGFVGGYLFYGVLKDRDNCKANQTEKDLVLAYIKQHGSISTDEAKAIGIKHLRSVICKMKKDGFSIKNVSGLGQIGVYKFK